MRVVSSNPFCYLGQRSIRSDDDDDNTNGYDYDYDINAVIQYFFRGSLVAANGKNLSSLQTFPFKFCCQFIHSIFPLQIGKLLRFGARIQT